jgi:hypothetical protein
LSNVCFPVSVEKNVHAAKPNNTIKISILVPFSVKKSVMAIRNAVVGGSTTLSNQATISKIPGRIFVNSINTASNVIVNNTQG